MRPPSLRNRIRNGTLLMLIIVIVLGGLAVPEVTSLGGAIRDTLYRNYVSIEAAAADAFSTICNTARPHAKATLNSRAGARSRIASIIRSMWSWAISPKSAKGRWHMISSGARQALFTELQSGVKLPPERYKDEFALLHQRIDGVTDVNEKAMFRADGHSSAWLIDLDL